SRFWTASGFSSTCAAGTLPRRLHLPTHRRPGHYTPSAAAGWPGHRAAPGPDEARGRVEQLRVGGELRPDVAGEGEDRDEEGRAEGRAHRPPQTHRRPSPYGPAQDRRRAPCRGAARGPVRWPATDSQASGGDRPLRARPARAAEPGTAPTVDRSTHGSIGLPELSAEKSSSVGADIPRRAEGGPGHRGGPHPLADLPRGLPERVPRILGGRAARRSGLHDRGDGAAAAPRVRSLEAAPGGGEPAAGERRLAGAGPPRRVPEGGVLAPLSQGARTVARPRTLGDHRRGLQRSRAGQDSTRHCWGERWLTPFRYSVPSVPTLAKERSQAPGVGSPQVASTHPQESPFEVTISSPWRGSLPANVGPWRTA